MVMPSVVHNKETVEIPTVVNMPREDAFRLLDTLGLKPMDGGSRMDAKIKPGKIAQQNPLPKTLVRKGRRVYLVTSGGEEKVSVPTLRGKSIRDARFALERSGLLLGEIVFNPSDDYPAGTILSQEIAPQTSISRGVRVNVTVSQGTYSDRVRVPDLAMKTLKEALALLQSQNFTIGKISYEPTIEFPPNTVLDQYPQANELVPLGQSIDLFVSQKQVKVTEH